MFWLDVICHRFVITRSRRQKFLDASDNVVSMGEQLMVAALADGPYWQSLIEILGPPPGCSLYRPFNYRRAWASPALDGRLDGERTLTAPIVLSMRLARRPGADLHQLCRESRMKLVRPGTNIAALWFMYLASAALLTMSALVFLWVGALVGASITVLLLGPLAFLAGYCFRHVVMARGRLPKFGVLRLSEDMEQANGQETPSS